MTVVYPWDAPGTGLSGVAASRERARELAGALLLSRETDEVVVESASVVSGGSGEYLHLTRERGIRADWGVLWTVEWAAS